MIKFLRKLIQKLFWSDRGFHESVHRMRMTACILNISFVVGCIVFLILFGLDPLIIICLALQISVLAGLYRKELKELWDKLFDNDKFDGGNFG